MAVVTNCPISRCKIDETHKRDRSSLIGLRRGPKGDETSARWQQLERLARIVRMCVLQTFAIINVTAANTRLHSAAAMSPIMLPLGFLRYSARRGTLRIADRVIVNTRRVRERCYVNCKSSRARRLSRFYKILNIRVRESSSGDCPPFVAKLMLTFGIKWIARIHGAIDLSVSSGTPRCTYARIKARLEGTNNRVYSGQTPRWCCSIFFDFAPPTQQAAEGSLLPSFFSLPF